MDRPENLLLRALPASEFERLSEHLKPVRLDLGDVLHPPGDPVETVHFIDVGLLSIVYSSPDGKSVEAGMVGREGASGLLEACSNGPSFMTVLVQVEGRGHRVPERVCRELAADSQAFRDAIWRYTELMLAESRQSVVCQASHEAESRCARWLMESRDRSGIEGRLPLTQEYLAAMLGVQRTTVVSIAGALQRRGLINYSRGKIDIVDAEGLDAAACDCRRALRDHRAARRPHADA